MTKRERAGATKRYRNFERETKSERDRKEAIATQTRTGQWAEGGGSATILPQHQPVRQKKTAASLNIYCTK
jgi:hypothetical protein